MNERLLNTNDEERGNIKLFDGYLELFGKSVEIPEIDGNAKICVTCWAKLQNAFSFRETCLQTHQDLLDSMLGQIIDCELSDPDDNTDVEKNKGESKVC
jgi:hypothetical protein